ncbi:MAG: MBL fold metallo-hydrolase [Bryobacteraceae bacterium]
MSKKITIFFVPCFALLTGLSAFGQQGAATAPRSANETVNPGSQQGAPGSPDGPRAFRLTTSTIPDNPESAAHKQAALRMAGSDPVMNKAYNFFCTPTRYNDPAPAIEPAKVFDNLYAIPSSREQQTIVWAITTSAGIILIDAGYPGTSDNILNEMKQLGLNPADVKYILLGHGHGDHYAAARYFQEQYGTHVGTTAADWDLMYPPNAPAPAANETPKPKRDLVLKEGAPVTLGNQTINLIEIPGHTPGALAFIFNVREGNTTHTAGLYGGTIQDQPRITISGLNQYLGSVAHYLEAVKKMNVDVEIQNHAMFDDTPARLNKLITRKPGDPHPFLMSNEKYVSLWTLVSECIRAEIARRPPGSK